MSLKDEVNNNLNKNCGLRVTDESAKAISDLTNSQDPKYISQVIQGIIPLPKKGN